MNTFKRKALFTAVVAAIGAAGAVAAAQPPPQFAQPILYPYYTVQDMSSSASSPTLVHEYLAAVNARARAAHLKAFSLDAAFLSGRQHEGFLRLGIDGAGHAASAFS